MKTDTQTASAAVNAQPQLIPIGQIVPDPKNRKEHNPEALKALAESIKVDGFLQPIVVRPMDSGKYMIIAGERRWHAHQLLKREVIEARVLANETDLQATRKRAAENLHRENLTPVEKAQQFQDLLDTGMTQAEIATFVSESQPAVANQLRLLALPPAVAKLLHEGKLSRAHGVTLARFAKWPKVVSKMAECAVKEETSAKDVERDELPFEYDLGQAKLLIELGTYHGYAATEAMKKDSDWLCFRNSLYCFDLTKGMAEKNRQDAELAKKVSEERSRAKSAATGGMSAADKAARARTIQKNKDQRTLLAAALVQATVKVKASQDDASKVLLAEAFEWQYESKLTAAAETLGIKLPDTIKRQTGTHSLNAEKLVTALGLASALKLAAVAIMIRQTEGALGGASSVPEVVELVAGKVKPPKATVSARNTKGGKTS